jgi:hypothetical protein
MMTSTKLSLALKNITESRLFFPLVALALILLFDLIFVPGFLPSKTEMATCMEA